MPSFKYYHYILKYYLMCLYLFQLSNNAFCTISAPFSTFIRENYGEETEKLLARRDLGPGGSFGGGEITHNSDIEKLFLKSKIHHRPVLLVHGLSTIAGEYENIRQHFLLNGYSDAEVFASSYAFGKLNWTKDSMECKHVKLIRVMLQAVSGYSNSQVDVIGYSMGSPIARKAILGGRCVDTGEELGPPLTHLVHSFLGVAGANSDAVHLCKLLQYSYKHGPCNNITGIRCHSRFLDDLNGENKLRFEASKRIYTIYSETDEIVGFKDCDGKPVSEIQGQDNTLKLDAHTHLTTIFLTPQQQMEMLKGKYDKRNKK
uniref:Triacylglycerol lipase n=1 Tax=Meloidogyne hapla TaxID=6305 RepID=A0A1I8BJ93_MELHA